MVLNLSIGLCSPPVGSVLFVSCSVAKTSIEKIIRPMMPLYLAILFKVMQEDGSHEGCIEQLQRLFTECLYTDKPRLDSDHRFRVDELELDPAIQAKVEAIWPQVTTENLNELSDFALYQTEFLRLFGFGVEGVDYSADTTPLVDAHFSSVVSCD